MSGPSAGPPLRLGVHPVPPGHLAAVVTFLERPLGAPAPGPAPPPPDRPLARGPPLALDRLRGADAARWRAAFARVGTPWLWAGHLVLPAGALAARLDDPAYEAFALPGADGADDGLLSLDLRDPRAASLAYFGLAPGATGRGLGTALMALALERARARGAALITVQTCTLDHPRALGFYRAAGFRAVARAVEVMPDPRAGGHLPEDAAPEVPRL